MNSLVSKVYIGFVALLLISSSVDATQKINVEKLYHKQCATCHGDNGDGRGRAVASLNPPPTDFTSLQAKKISKQKMYASIRDGVQGSSMVAYGRRLDEATINALVEFIQTRFMGKPLTASAAHQGGRAIYEQHCAVCHGDNGSSAVWAKNGLNPPPRDFTSQVAQQELSRERMLLSVTHGRPGTAMMPFSSRLSEQEIESVVDFIRHNFMQKDVTGLVNQDEDGNNSLQPPVETSMNDSSAYPGMLVGDPQKGEKFYQSNCYVCHGKKGGGDGPRAHFNRPRPRDFTSRLSQEELTRSRLFKSISQGRRGSVMPAWSTVLSKQQIADVAEYVYQAFLHPEKKKP